jgi:hypothetical protein
MTRRTRGTLIVLAVLGTLLGAEVVLNLLKDPEALVLVENKGPEPIEGLVVAFGSRKAEVAYVAPGETARLLMSGRGTQTLQLSFRQKGNAMGGYQVPGFDPGLMSRDGSKLVLEIHPNQVIRYQDEGEPSTPVGRYASDVGQRVWKSMSTLD